MAEENIESTIDKPSESGIMTSGDTEGRDDRSKSTTVSAQRGYAEGQGSDIPERMPTEGLSAGEGRRRTSGVDRPEGGELSERGSEPDGFGSVGTGSLEPSNPVADPGERERLNPPRDIVLTKDSDVDADVGPASRFDANLAALHTIKALEAEGRQATPEEQATIAKFSGFGDSDFNDAFDIYEREGIWKRRGDELREITTEDEYQKIERSRLTAYFTTPEVIKTMWDGLREMGVDNLKHPRILEPSAGSGRFFGYQPQDLASRSTRIAVELDTLSGQMLKQAYPEAEVYVMGYQDAPIAKDSIDVAISNVPFGHSPVTDPDFRKGRRILSRSIHNYFFAKALDQLRPGGVLAFITSHHTLDAPTSQPVREALAERADLVRAIRLPRGTFRDTEVVTDIIFMRKREPEDEPGDKSWVNSSQIMMKTRYGYDQPYNVNQYFIDHPEMVLGTHSTKGSMRGQDEYSVEAGDTPLEARLKDAIAQLPRNILKDTEVRESRTRSSYLPSALNVLEGAHVIGEDGDIAVKRHGNMEHVTLSPDEYARVTGMLTVRDAARKVLRTQLDDMPAADLHATQATLNETYDAYVKIHGALNAKLNVTLLKGDPDGPFLRSLERWDPRENAKPFRAGKALSDNEVDIFKMPIFTRPVIKGTGQRDAKDVTDALAISLDNTGRLDFDLMAETLGMDAQSVKRRLEESRQIFKNPVGDWETEDKYLSGEVREKLRVAKAAATVSSDYNANVVALQAVQPEDLTPSQISVRLGTPWIPGTDLDEFITELLGAYRPWRAREKGYFNFVSETGKWVRSNVRIEGDSAKMISEYGTRRMPADKIIERILVDKPIELKDPDDKNKRDDQATVAAQEKATAIQEAFKKWVWSDPDRASRLAATYNETFNATRPRRFDGSHLVLPGIADEWAKKLHSHQKDAIWRVIQDRTALLAHEVGFGKTAVMVGSGMELKRLGLANKVMYVVPKATHAQFADQFLALYPHSNVLMPEDSDFSTEKRPEFISRAVTGDWDAIILSNEQFKRIPIKPETAAAFLKQEVNNFRAALEAEAEKAGGVQTKSHKELQAALERLEQKLREAQLAIGEKTEHTTYFEDMGVDQLFVDEADNFKNLQFATTMGRLKGLPNSESKRAWDMYQKTRYLQQHGKGTGVTFATGTPIANTIAEMYTMMRYLQEPMLEARGLQSFDAWAKTFGETVESLEQTTTGTYRMTQRFSKFMNAPELSQLWQQVADIRVADEVPALVKQRPRLVDEKGKPKRTVIAVPPDEQLLDYMAVIVQRADELSGKDPKEDNMLKIAGDARKAALDMRMVSPNATPNPNGKVPVMASKVADIYRDTTKDKGTQLIFLDLGTPKAKDKAVDEDIDASTLGDDEETAEETSVLRNVYKVIKENLVAKGIPVDEIAFIHDAKTKAQRESIQKRVNNGDIRVIIGSTGKMGVGLNVQERAAALHHLDAP